MIPHIRSFRFLTLFAMLLILQASSVFSDETMPERFPVTVKVDFGPAGKKAISTQAEVVRGATPETALALFCQLEKGAACCDPREISGIDGVAIDPATARWWTVSINGSRNVSPYETKLKPNDVVLWKYIQSEQ